MTARKLYVSIPGLSGITSVYVTHSHSAATATAVIQCIDHSKSIGDLITINLGFTDNHDRIFKGYIKQIERKIPDDVYTITCQDVLVQAVDYFVVSSNPDTPFKRRGITAEDLIGAVLELAGITNYAPDASYFTLGINTDAEVNLVSAYDYCKMICDLVAYSMWADQDGIVRFRNRKPHVIEDGDPEHSQPGIETDVPLDITIINLDTAYNRNERDLRNRVVCYGADGIFAEASSSTSYDPWDKQNKPIMPGGYFKSMAAASPIIDDQTMAQQSADYNLLLYNRVGIQFSSVVEGNPQLIARNCIKVTNPILGITDLPFYIYTSEHRWGVGGYTVNLDLRR